jgi:predicted RNA-binding Zn-ribbon protein involved in translation (DUF1610 family)
MSRRNSVNAALQLHLPLQLPAQQQQQSWQPSTVPITPPTSLSSSDRDRDRMQISPPVTPISASASGESNSNSNSDNGSSRGNKRNSRVLVISSARLPSPAPAPKPRTGSVSARVSTANTIGIKPTCPKCGRNDEVHRFGFWIKRSGLVWLCSAELRGSDGHGSGFCEHIFFEDKPRAECPWCGVRLQVERRGGTFGFYCINCATWSE